MQNTFLKRRVIEKKVYKPTNMYLDNELLGDHLDLLEEQELKSQLVTINNNRQNLV